VSDEIVSRHRQGDTQRTSRVRIVKVPALRYEGIDLSPYRVGQAYDVDRRLADLLINLGYATSEAVSERNAGSRKR
jgi:hypothetical protein